MQKTNRAFLEIQDWINSELWSCLLKEYFLLKISQPVTILLISKGEKGKSLWLYSIQHFTCYLNNDYKICKCSKKITSAKVQIHASC